MTKYSKGITIFRLHISVTDKDSFEECNEEILEELERHPELDTKVREQIIREVLYR